MLKARIQTNKLIQFKSILLLHFISETYTCQASVSLWAPGASLRWTALTEVEVTLVVIQGVVLRANTRGLSALCVVLWKDVIWIGGPLCGGQWMGLHRICTRHYLESLGHVGGHRVVHSDLRDRLLGVLVLWFRSSLSFSAGHHSECNHNYSQKGQLTGDKPHG